MTGRREPLVRVQGVSMTYREPAARTVVLEGTSFTLARGETTSLMGVSGSGKSTLLALIAGLMRPESGSIVIDGQDVTVLDEFSLARLRARRVGIVMQRGNLIPFLTALENVELAITLAGGRRREQGARDLLCRLGLGARMNHLPRRLSGGEAQRVAVAVALVNEPDLLLADEVTGELDATSAEQVIGVILDAWRERGLTVLFVTHSADLASRAQQRLRLADGTVQPA